MIIFPLLDLNGNEIKFSPKVITTHFKEDEDLALIEKRKDIITFDFFEQNFGVQCD